MLRARIACLEQNAAPTTLHTELGSWRVKQHARLFLFSHTDVPIFTPAFLYLHQQPALEQLAFTVDPTRHQLSLALFLTLPLPCSSSNNTGDCCRHVDAQSRHNCNPVRHRLSDALARLPATLALVSWSLSLYWTLCQPPLASGHHTIVLTTPLCTM